MNKDKDSDIKKKSNESNPPVSKTTDKTGQRQGGIDKDGIKEKDKKGEL